MSMRSLIDVAVEHGIISPPFKDRLDAWMRLRNEVVHSAMPVTKAQATEVVNGVMGWIGQQ